MTYATVLMTRKPVKDVTFVLLNDDNLALMQHRTDDARRYPGAWCFPGEGMEDADGGSHLKCVIRGVLEEYGLAVTERDCDHLMTYEHDGTDVDAVYLVRIGRQVPTLKEGKGMEWMLLRRISTLNLGFEQERILPTFAHYIQ